MRQVLSLSLPLEVTNKIKTRSKQKGFDSVSSYIKYLVTLDNDLMPEDELVQAVRESRSEYNKGKSIKADSIAELLDDK